MVEGLLVDGIDRDLRAAEHAGIVEGADLDHDDRYPRPVDEVRPAFGAKFACHRFLQIAAGKLLGRALGVFEAVGRHRHEEVVYN